MDRTEEQERVNAYLSSGEWDESPNYPIEAHEIMAAEFAAANRDAAWWQSPEDLNLRSLPGYDPECFDRDAERGTWRTTAEMPRSVA